MKNLANRMVIAALLITAPTLALAGSWTPSLTFPTTDANGVAMQATELRQFAYLNEYTPSAALYAGGGFFGRQDNGRGLQIYVLNAPPAQGGAWKVDINVDDLCASLGMAKLCFETTDALQAIPFTKDANGAPVDTSVLTLGPYPNGGKAKSATCNSVVGQRETWTLSRNSTDGQWYGDRLACDRGDVRVYSWAPHTDAVTGQQFNFAGEGDTGLFPGQLNPNQGVGQHPILWSQTPEWLSTSYTGPANCQSGYGGTDHHRITGFAELVGADGISRAYMSTCFTTYVRIDGPSPGAVGCGPQEVDVSGNCVARWQPYWFATAQNRSTDGLRGLTALTEDSPQDMITGYEGPSTAGIGIYRIPALCPSSNSACAAAITCGDFNSLTGIVTRINVATCAKNEYVWADELKMLSGISGGSVTEPRNRAVPFYDSTGTLRRIVPFDTGVKSTKANPAVPPQPTWSFMYLGNRQLAPAATRWADGAYLVRSKGGSYTLSVIPPLFPTPEEGTRDCTPSPFASEATLINGHWSNAAIYCGGFDVSGSAGGSKDPIYWCAAGLACPPNPVLVDTYNTAWIAHYGPGSSQ